MKLIRIFYQSKTSQQKNGVFQGISSFTLHIIAMLLMLVEGYFHTHNLKKYLGRLLFWAILSELPFNLMYGGCTIYPFHLLFLPPKRAYGGDLAKKLELTPATISHHMSALLAAGLVKIEKEDTKIYYIANRAELEKVVNAVNQYLL